MTKKRPEVLRGDTIKIKSDCGPLYLTLNTDENGLYEIFLKMGKKGSCKDTDMYLLGVFMSIALQGGVSKDKFIKTVKRHLIGVKCEMGESCYDKIGQEILKATEKVPA